MKVALIGATGFVGSALLQELLRRQHQVVALVRDPAKLASANNLSAVKTDVLNVNQVVSAVSGCDAVISAYNPGWTNPNIYEEFLAGSKSIQEGVKIAGVKRLLVVGGAGSLYDDQGQQLVDSPHFPKEIYAGANGARDYLNILKNENNLDWTYLSPPPALALDGLGERTGHYRVGLEHPLSTEGGLGRISAADLAVALVDELENGRHVKQRFTVAY